MGPARQFGEGGRWPFWGRLVREPLLHFLLAGAALFWLYAARTPPRTAPPPDVIEVTQNEVARLARRFETVWRRPPDRGELAGLIEEHVRGEVLYREALALGLDRGDTVIRRRLVQKMEFLSGAAAEPDEAALRAHFSAHPERFTTPARVSFRQVFLGDADPREARDALAAGADPKDAGQGTLLPPVMERAARDAVDRTFGEGFFDAVNALAPGTWQGPVVSSHGAHLVRLAAAEAETVPDFTAVREAVASDWRRRTEEDLGNRRYEAMRERYRIVLPPPGPAAP